jgi:hypothetical protein
MLSQSITCFFGSIPIEHKYQSAGQIDSLVVKRDAVCGIEGVASNAIGGNGVGKGRNRTGIDAED